jgi:hypothetical protein
MSNIPIISKAVITAIDKDKRLKFYIKKAMEDMLKEYQESENSRRKLPVVNPDKTIANGMPENSLSENEIADCNQKL